MPAATSEIQIVAYHDNEDGTFFHFAPDAPQVGPITFVSDDGICQEGWVDGIVTSVTEVDGVVPTRWAATVHSTLNDSTYAVVVVQQS